MKRDSALLLTSIPHAWLVRTQSCNHCQRAHFIWSHPVPSGTMTPAESAVEEVVELREKESDPAPRWDVGRDDVHGSAKETNTENIGEHNVGENGNFDSGKDAAEVDYWEEVALEDGSVCFYNHTSQEYSPALPSNNYEMSATGEMPASRASGGELQTPAEWESGTDISPERLDGQMWDGVNGEVFVPWPDKKPEDMRYSPGASGTSEGHPDAPEEDNEEPFVPDDPAIVREQNLRALLVLLPAKVVKNVVKVAMDGAVLHRRRTATADAERRRRSLLSSRAQFRHTMHHPPKRGQGSSRSGENKGDGGDTDDEEQTCRTAEGENAEAAGTSDLWRNTMTQERDTIVGQELEEVLQVLYSASTLEARLTMRAINLSSQGIGATGAQRLAPALKSCVVVALFLGNNAMGDRGITLLADGLRHARGLQNLHLNDNEITDVGCHRLASALGPLRVLSTLDLCHNPFGDKACLALASYLSQPECPLRYLSVAGCLDIDPAAWKTIRVRGREGVGWDPPRPGDDGAVSIAAALMSPHGCSLRGLRMANAGMRLIGAKAIAAALCANHTLETIDLSGNDFACKDGENAWESASELLSFGLQVNTTVHTIVLRACGLTREQVLAMQQNCSRQTIGAQDCQRETDHGAHHGVEVGDGSGAKSGGARQKGPLPWREEKRLGFRAARLRDWLLDAARVKGMRYPPLALDQQDAVSSKTDKQIVKNDTPVVESPTDVGLHVGGTESDSREGQDHILVGPQLWSGLLALRRLVALYRPAASLPSGWNSADGNIGGKIGSCCTSRRTKLPPQGPETNESTVTVASDAVLAECDRKTLFSPSKRVRGIDVSSRESLPPTNQTSEHDRTCLNLGPRSSTSTSARYLDRPRGATMRAINSASGLSPCSSEGARLLAANEPRSNILSTEAWRQESEPISAGDLEAAATEGQRLASAAANTCKSLDEREDALSHERESLWQDWDGFSTRATGEASSLELALVDALAARDAARDNLRLLEPIAAAARNAEKAGRMEMEHFATRRRPECEAVGAPAALINLDLLEEDFRDRSGRAQELAERLRDARHRVEATEKDVKALEVAEQNLRLRSAASDTAYRENTEALAASVAGLHAKRTAFRRIEKSLAALVATVGQLAEAARGEESLRALVPAGSNRRELDLQVADAVRATTRASRDMEQTRLRRDEAAQRLDQARHSLVTAEAREGSGEILVLLAGAADRAQDSRVKAHVSDQDAAKAENVRQKTEAYGKADRDFLDAQELWESARIKRALELIRDHNDILRLKKEDASDGRAGLADVGRGGVVEGRPAAQRRPGGDAASLGVQLNARIDLGAKIALLRGSGEEDESGNLALPEVDDRFLTAGQRLRRLQDAREVVRKEKHKAYVQHSRKVKKNLRARKRLVLAEKRASRMAQTLDSRELVDALKGRGCDVDGSEQRDQLRRIFVEEVRPELHVRLHATSRWTKGASKRRERMSTLGIGEIVARRQRAMLSKEGGNPHPLVGHSFRPAATAQ